MGCCESKTKKAPVAPEDAQLRRSHPDTSNDDTTGESLSQQWQPESHLDRRMKQTAGEDEDGRVGQQNGQQTNGGQAVSTQNKDNGDDEPQRNEGNAEQEQDQHDPSQKITLSDSVQEKIASIKQGNHEGKVVDLSQENLGIEAARMIGDALRQNKSLEVLDLSKNQLDDEGVRTLSEALQHNDTLQKIYLSNNNLGDETCRALSEALRSNSTLKEVRLNGNNITDSGADILIEVLRNLNCTMLHIDVQGNKNLNSDKKNELEALLRRNEGGAGSQNALEDVSQQRTEGDVDGSFQQSLEEQDPELDKPHDKSSSGGHEDCAANIDEGTVSLEGKNGNHQTEVTNGESELAQQGSQQFQESKNDESKENRTETPESTIVQGQASDQKESDFEEKEMDHTNAAPEMKVNKTDFEEAKEDDSERVDMDAKLQTNTDSTNLEESQQHEESTGDGLTRTPQDTTDTANAEGAPTKDDDGQHLKEADANERGLQEEKNTAEGSLEETDTGSGGEQDLESLVGKYFLDQQIDDGVDYHSIHTGLVNQGALTEIDLEMKRQAYQQKLLNTLRELGAQLSFVRDEIDDTSPVLMCGFGSDCSLNETSFGKLLLLPRPSRSAFANRDPHLDKEILYSAHKEEIDGGESCIIYANPIPMDVQLEHSAANEKLMGALTRLTMKFIYCSFPGVGEITAYGNAAKTAMESFLVLRDCSDTDSHQGESTASEFEDSGVEDLLESSTISSDLPEDQPSTGTRFARRGRKLKPKSIGVLFGPKRSKKFGRTFLGPKTRRAQPAEAYRRFTKIKIPKGGKDENEIRENMWNEIKTHCKRLPDVLESLGGKKVKKEDNESSKRKFPDPKSFLLACGVAYEPINFEKVRTIVLLQQPTEKAFVMQRPGFGGMIHQEWRRWTPELKTQFTNGELCLLNVNPLPYDHHAMTKFSKKYMNEYLNNKTLNGSLPKFAMEFVYCCFPNLEQVRACGNAACHSVATYLESMDSDGGESRQVDLEEVELPSAPRQSRRIPRDLSSYCKPFSNRMDMYVKYLECLTREAVRPPWQYP